MIRDHIEEELPHLRRYAHSMTRDREDADDLVQDCVVRAIAKEDQFKPGTHPRRWLFTILRNINIDNHRRNAHRRSHEYLMSRQQATHQIPAQEDWVELVELKERIDDLRQGDRDLLYLSVFAGLPHKKIAKRFGIAVGTVKSRLSRMRDQLTDY